MKWEKFINSKYFFTVACLSYIILMTAALILIMKETKEKQMEELWNQGRDAAVQEDYVSAVQKLEEAVTYIGSTIEEQDFQLVEDLAQMQVMAKLSEEAIETYSRLIRAGKTTADIYMKRGSLYDQMNEYALTLEDYKNAVKADPYNREVYETIAQQLESMNHLVEAEIFRNTAIQFLGE